MSKHQQTHPDPKSEDRIEKTLRQVQREVGTCDVLTFTFGRAWSTLLVVASVFVVVLEKWAISGAGPNESKPIDNGSD